MVYRYEFMVLGLISPRTMILSQDVLLVQTRSQLGNKLIPAVRMVNSFVEDCLFFPAERDFFNFGAWLAAPLVFLNFPLSNDLIRYNWGLGDL